MLEYVRDHWRGDLSLAQSYWANTFLLGVLLNVSFIVIEGPLSRLRIQTAAVTNLFLIVLMIFVTLWQLVGVWRSATKTAAISGRNLWPGIAKAVVIFGGLAGGLNVLTATGDVLKVLRAIQQPEIADYTLERLGESDLILTGAINDRSVDEVINSLKDPLIAIVRINSHGGLIEPAVRLARYVLDNDIFVMAEGQCDSACVFVLAASPYAAVYPGTQVIFHQAEGLAEFSTSEAREEQERYLKQVDGYDREFGIPEWVTAKLKYERFWAPTLMELVQMDLLVNVYDPELNEFVPAEEFCAGHDTICLERPPIDQ